MLPGMAKYKLQIPGGGEGGGGCQRGSKRVSAGLAQPNFRLHGKVLD